MTVVAGSAVVMLSVCGTACDAARAVVRCAAAGSRRRTAAAAAVMTAAVSVCHCNRRLLQYNQNCGENQKCFSECFHWMIPPCCD